MFNRIRSTVEEPASKRLKLGSEEETPLQWEGYKLKRSTKYYIEKMKITNSPVSPNSILKS